MSNELFTAVSKSEAFHPSPNQRSKRRLSAMINSQHMLKMTLNLVTDSGEPAMIIKRVVATDVNQSEEYLVLFYL